MQLEPCQLTLAGDRGQGKEKEGELMSKEAIGGVGEGAAKPSGTWCPL